MTNNNSPPQLASRGCLCLSQARKKEEGSAVDLQSTQVKQLYATETTQKDHSETLNLAGNRVGWRDCVARRAEMHRKDDQLESRSVESSK